jgi:hypothetical protein
VTLTVTDQNSADPNPDDNCEGGCTVTITVSQGTHPLSDPNYPQFPGTVNFMVGGQTVQSFSINDVANNVYPNSGCTSTSPPNNCTISVTYTPTANGSISVTAQVIDSVLYDSTTPPQTVNTQTTSSP